MYELRSAFLAFLMVVTPLFASSLLFDNDHEHGCSTRVRVPPPPGARPQHIADPLQFRVRVLLGPNMHKTLRSCHVGGIRG